MSKETWSKKKGLDLRWDKRTIVIDEIKEKGRESEEIPEVESAQVHLGRENYSRIKSDGSKSHKKLKKRIKGRIARLSSKSDWNWRAEKLRRIAALVRYVVGKNGSFNLEEADAIVDAYMISRPRNESTLHPLQTSFKHIPRYKDVGPSSSVPIFSHFVFKEALAKRGFYLNIGPFSEAESLTLMKNFESFLTKHGKATDRESIWNLLNDRFASFYQASHMFTHIGKNLNRSSLQMSQRLFSLYHPYEVGRWNAKIDAVLLEQNTISTAKGASRRGLHKYIGEQINRYNYSVGRRLEFLKSVESSISRPSMKVILTLIASLQNCHTQEINVSNIPFEKIAQKLGINEEAFRSFWSKVGERACIRASLPKWTLEDSLALLKEIESTEEDEERCIDFKAIHDRCFQGKVENWEHLREHFNRLRRVAPYYMLKDLPTTLAEAEREVKKRIQERDAKRKTDPEAAVEAEAEAEAIGEDGIEDDEDEFMD